MLKKYKLPIVLSVFLWLTPQLQANVTNLQILSLGNYVIFLDGIKHYHNDMLSIFHAGLLLDVVTTEPLPELVLVEKLFDEKIASGNSLWQTQHYRDLKDSLAHDLVDCLQVKLLENLGYEPTDFNLEEQDTNYLEDLQDFAEHTMDEEGAVEKNVVSLQELFVDAYEHFGDKFDVNIPEIKLADPRKVSIPTYVLADMTAGTDPTDEKAMQHYSLCCDSFIAQRFPYFANMRLKDLIREFTRFKNVCQCIADTYPENTKLLRYIAYLFKESQESCIITCKLLAHMDDVQFIQNQASFTLNTLTNDEKQTINAMQNRTIVQIFKDAFAKHVVFGKANPHDVEFFTLRRSLMILLKNAIAETFSYGLELLHFVAIAKKIRANQSSHQGMCKIIDLGGSEHMKNLSILLQLIGAKPLYNASNHDEIEKYETYEDCFDASDRINEGMIMKHDMLQSLFAQGVTSPSVHDKSFPSLDHIVLTEQI